MQLISDHTGLTNSSQTPSRNLLANTYSLIPHKYVLAIFSQILRKLIHANVSQSLTRKCLAKLYSQIPCKIRPHKHIANVNLANSSHNTTHRKYVINFLSAICDQFYCTSLVLISHVQMAVCEAFATICGVANGHVFL